MIYYVIRGLILFSIIFMFFTGLFTLRRNIPKGVLTAGLERYREGKKMSGFHTKVKKLSNLLMYAGRRDTFRKELSDCLAYIRNIAILGRGKAMSSEGLLEELASISNHLSTVFLDMAHAMHMGRREEAPDILKAALGKGWAGDIGNFLVRWESVPERELLSTIEAYRDILRAELATTAARKDEVASDIIYFPVIVCAMTVLLNFVYIAYFIEQKEMLLNMF